MDTPLKQVWEALCSRYSADVALVAQLWEELEQAYTSKGRHYHTLDHLAYMLQLAEKHGQKTEQYDLLLFAVFYHDLVYSATRSYNEEKSAAIAGKRLAMLALAATDIAIVKEMILATKNHREHANVTVNLLLDLDLAILGADQDRYGAYSQAVRKEYSLYPEMIYKPGRRKVLQHFLAQPTIYKTALFRQQYEEQARQNLQRELSHYT